VRRVRAQVAREDARRDVASLAALSAHERGAAARAEAAFARLPVVAAPPPPAPTLVPPGITVAAVLTPPIEGAVDIAAGAVIDAAPSAVSALEPAPRHAVLRRHLRSVPSLNVGNAEVGALLVGAHAVLVQEAVRSAAAAAAALGAAPGGRRDAAALAAAAAVPLVRSVPGAKDGDGTVTTLAPRACVAVAPEAAAAAALEESAAAEDEQRRQSLLPPPPLFDADDSGSDADADAVVVNL
jgi:hypothetical protein